MGGPIYRFTFDPKIPFESVEVTLLRAVIAVESLHGETQVRLDAAHCLDLMQRCCLIDASTKVGQDFSRLFTGFAGREFGADSFRVERVEASRRSAFAGTGGAGNG